MRSTASLIALFASAIAFAAEGSPVALTGIWVGQVPSRFGEVQDLAFRFAVSDGVLSGKMYGESESFPLTDAKLDGDHFTFRITTEMNGGHTYLLFNGTLKDGQIQMIRIRELPPDADEAQRKRNLPQTFSLRRLI